MTNAVYRTELNKESMVFSAAHFITFNGNICESIHGHNYGVPMFRSKDRWMKTDTCVTSSPCVMGWRKSLPS